MTYYLKSLQVIVLSSIVLYFGKSFFIPMSIALLIACLLYPVCKWFERLKLGRSLSIGLAMSIMVILISALLVLLLSQLNGFAKQWPAIRTKMLVLFGDLTSFLIQRFNIPLDMQQKWIENFAGTSGSKILPLLGSTTYSLSVALVLLLLIPLLAALILYYRALLLEVLIRLFPKQTDIDIKQLLLDSITSYYRFVKGMGLVYVIVAVLNSVGLALLGIPNPVFFGVVASLLTFIPYVGIMVASLLPVSVAWITYSSVWYPIGVIVVFGVVQVLEANIIFPLIVSSRLKLNTLVTLMAILAGGIVWGAIGMVLFIPFLGILKLVADRTKQLETLALILGNGEFDKTNKKMET